MSPTLDEQATTTDPQVTADHHAVLLFQTIARAIDIDGVRRPWGVTLPYGTTNHARLQYGSGCTADVDDWGLLLGATPVLDPTILVGPGHWRKYEVTGVLDGMHFEVWCTVPVDESEQVSA
ncbi:hypothetical protein ABT297_04265 [Dactylosporangium sp. NPDC000555]|uniref:hypothetical protein n=1 Tax=Dactylosporangium sp. NPDC000555 TaxID=3154260 RepID=UPI00332582D0